MAKAATVALGVTLLGDGLSSTITVTIPPNSTSPAGHQQIALSSGNNTLTPPSGTLFALIVPPSASAVAKILKGVNGDTGVGISPGTPTLISFATSPGTFVINAGSSETVDVYWL